MTRNDFLKVSAAAALASAAPAQDKQPNPDLGFTDTPMLPGMPWHVHDPARPHPKVVVPGNAPGAPPSDAIVLFDGTGLSKWQQRGRGENQGKLIEPTWKLGDGYFEVAGNSGSGGLGTARWATGQGAGPVAGTRMVGWAPGQGGAAAGAERAASRPISPRKPTFRPPGRVCTRAGWISLPLTGRTPRVCKRVPVTRAP